MTKFGLWNNTPGHCEEVPAITVYEPKSKKSRAAVVIFPGGAYRGRAEHEGKGYAEFLAEHGITAFVVDYRVSPHTFPLELLDARRAVRFVRANADKYSIDRDKVAVMGSSAGGHLAALISTYTKPIEFEGADSIDDEDFLPSAQILCYPVILSPDHEGVSHKGSYKYLLGSENHPLENELDPANNVTKTTPPAFIWHTAEDRGVSVINSYTYATKLRENGVPVEMHVFPYGGHGLGLAKNHPHVAQWSDLLINWFKLLEWL